MRYRTKEGVVIEGETSSDIVHCMREESWNEENLSDRAYMEAVADRLFQEGVPVSTLSPDIFIAGLLNAGLLKREVEGTQSDAVKQIDS